MKVEENAQHFWHIMLYYLKKGKNATGTQKQICAVCGEGAVTNRTCPKWFVKFCVEISHRTMLHGRVDQLRVIAIKSRH